MATVNSVRLTAEGKARLEEEHRTLVQVRLPTLTGRIREIAAFEDGTDNNESEELKEERAQVEARIEELERLLARAEVIEPTQSDGVVQLGSRVTLRADDGEVETWTVVAPVEANAHGGSISTDSPVGRALLGCRLGDTPTVTTPGGTIVYTVLEVA